MKTIWTIGLCLILAHGMVRADVTMNGQGTVTNVVDGNRVHVQSSGRTWKLRLTGMLAPDLDELGGKPARDALAEFVRSKTLHFVVYSEARDGDYWFAWLGLAETNGNVNIRMVKEGFARADEIRVRNVPGYLRVGISDTMEAAIKKAETAAQTAGIGIWRSEKGPNQQPEGMRR